MQVSRQRSPGRCRNSFSLTTSIVWSRRAKASPQTMFHRLVPSTPKAAAGLQLRVLGIAPRILIPTAPGAASVDYRPNRYAWQSVALSQYSGFDDLQSEHCYTTCALYTAPDRVIQPGGFKTERASSSYENDFADNRFSLFQITGKTRFGLERIRVVRNRHSISAG